MLEHSPSVDANAYKVAGETPLQAACFRGCSLSLLIRKLFQGSKVRADSRARGSKLIHWACQSNRPTAPSIAVELLNRGFDPNDCSMDEKFFRGETALMVAAPGRK